MMTDRFRTIPSGTTRRRFLAGAAGASAVAATIGPAGVFAQGGTPVATPVSPGATPAAPAIEPPDMTDATYEFQIGSFACRSVSDGADAGALAPLIFADTPQDVVDQAVSGLGIDVEQMVLQHTSTVIDTGSELVLVDTGSGRAALPTAGILIDNLRRRGIQAADIDVVVLTHAHGDHIGGNLTASGNSLYPNARYVMSQEEWDFWTDPQAVQATGLPEDFVQQALAAVEANLLPLDGQIELIGYDEEIVPGVRSVAAQGHTPGHMGLRVESDGELLWVMGDMALHPAALAFPEIIGLPDTEPERLIETRTAVFARIADEGGIAVFNHFDPFPSIGQVVAEGDAWMWEPVEVDAVEEEA